MQALDVDFAAGGITMVVVDGDGRIVERPAGAPGEHPGAACLAMLACQQ
jgi:hypothetical protein